MFRQISVFLENKRGKLAEVTGVLADNNIDMWAISIADTTNFGILRIIVDDPDKAVDVMRNAGYTVSTTEVLAVEVPDQPGGLHQVLDILRKEGISIEYLYSFVRRPAEKALILFKVDCLNDAVDILKRTGISVLTNDQVCGL
ncbi:MAG: ACT domain-containing protein [Caldicoprobacteraceae bacterium]